MKMFEESYGKYGKVLSMTAGGIKLSVTTQIGPRVIFFGKEGGANLL